MNICFKAILPFVLCVLQACATVDLDQPKPISMAAAVNTNAPLVRAAETLVNIEQESAFLPLSEGDAALAVRLTLIEQATESLDLQYFLMKNDATGYLVTHRLLAAADRGVKVRFLLDDVFTTVKDEKLYLLDQHPNIEVRLFNPLSRRGIKSLNFLGDFKRANRRMHNKSFTADGAFTVVGGRNIADEYFALTEHSYFFDFDVLAVGEVAAQVSNSFDDFWNFKKSVPIAQLKSLPKQSALDKQKDIIAENYEKKGRAVFQEMLAHPLGEALAENRSAFIKAPSKVISDSPEKLLRDISIENMEVRNTLVSLVKKAKKEVILITPYFIPTGAGDDVFGPLLENGVEIILLTNSLASTNHLTVHAHYSKYRKDLLDMGVALYETRPDAAQTVDERSMAETSTMHTKLVLIDERYVFVGSPNLDPRSLEINTEMGILIDSPELAQIIINDDNDMLAKMLYRLDLKEGKLQWTALKEGQEVYYHKEPESSTWRRFKSWFYRILPEEQM